MSIEQETSPRSMRIRRLWWVALVAFIPFFIACQSDEEKLAGFKARAEEYVEAGQDREAVIEYRNALQIDPNDSESHRGLAKAYLRLGEVGDAYWELSETVRLSPDDREARNTYAAISLANGRYEEVLEQADALIAMDPTDEVGLVLRAQAYERLGREAEVEPIMREVIAAHPEKTEYLVLLANFLIRQGDVEGAETVAREAIAIEPTYAAVAQLMRITAATQGSDEDVEALLLQSIELATTEQAERAAALAAGDEDAAKGVDMRPEAYTTTARFYLSRERTADGIALLEKGSEALADHSEAQLELMYMLAGVHRQEGDEAAAADVMRRAAEMGESNPDPFLVLSTYRSGQEDWEGSLEAAEQALEVDPDAPKTRLRYAEALIEAGVGLEKPELIEQGEKQLDGVIADFPGMPEALFVIGKLALSQQDYDRAIEVLSSALEAKPDWPQARLMLGSALFSKRELARARVELARAIELDPSLIQARRALIRVHSSLGEHEYAIDQGKPYLDQRPKDNLIRIIVAQSLVRVGRIDEAKALLAALPEDARNARASFAMARIAMAEGDFAEARKLMEPVEAEMPHHERVLETYLSLDQAEGRLPESSARVAAAIEADPENAALREMQGVIAALEGDMAKAEESYKKAIELDPKALSSYSKLAALYNSQGKIDETIATYESAVAVDPQAASAHHFLAVLYEMTGRSTKAREHYEAAIASDDGMAESKNNLAYLLATSGEDLDRALTLAQEAKAAMPGNPNTADTLGWVLLKRGVPTAAVGYFREALSNMPADDPARGEVQYHLGLGYSAAGQSEEATASLQSALEHLDGQLDAARAAGQSAGEPAWASQARAELQRLTG